MWRNVMAVVLGPMTPICLLIAATFFLRWYDGKYGLGVGVDVRPTPAQLDPPIPAFCAGLENDPVARSNIFYYDLGGTYCACEKQWNVQEYWGKTFSGLAFNLPHFIDLIAACLVYGDFRFACFLIFLNEWIEEMVVAVSPHWGFNGDPYMDLEPRYDTLMRDVIHGFLGMWLASSVMHVTASRGYADLAGALTRPLFDTEAARKSSRTGKEAGSQKTATGQASTASAAGEETASTPAQVDLEVASQRRDAEANKVDDAALDAPVGLFPLRLKDWLRVFTHEGSAVCASDASSPVRLLRMHLAFFGCWRQMFMLYNLDAGIRAFSFQNVCLALLVALWYAAMFRLNRCHMPRVPPTRLAVQHCVPGVICAGACLACVYPPIPTIYLIMMIEGAAKLALTLFEVLLLASPRLKAGLCLDVGRDPLDVDTFLRSARVPGGTPLRTLITELLVTSPLPGEGPALPLLSNTRGQAGAGEGQEEGDVRPVRTAGECEMREFGSGVDARGDEAKEERVGSVLGLGGGPDDEEEGGESSERRGASTGAAAAAEVEARVRVVLERLQRAEETSGGAMAQLGASGALRVGFNLSFALFLITMAAIQPLSYEGTQSLAGGMVSVQYARHWCGNPKGVAAKKNTCLSAPNASGSGH